MVTNERRAVDGDSIGELLREGGWVCDRITDDIWRAQFHSRQRTFPLFVRLDPAGFLTFAIVPFLRAGDEASAARLYRRLLELNHRLMMAKFSIDDDLDVVLSVEYPLEELDPSEFHDALDALSFYADRYYEELQGPS